MNYFFTHQIKNENTIRWIRKKEKHFSKEEKKRIKETKEKKGKKKK